MGQATVIAATALAAVSLVALVSAAVSGLDGWGAASVVAGAFLATVGATIARDPLRRN